MSTATDSVFRADAEGVNRLVAAPGDDTPAGTTAPLPPTVTKGPANYDSTPNGDVIRAAVPAVSTAGNDASHVLGEVKNSGTVVSVAYIPDALITGVATNNRRLRLINKGQDGTGTTIVAELQFTNGTNAAAFDSKAVALSVAAGNLAVAAGDVLAFESTHIGTGLADPGGQVVVEINPA